MTTSTSDQTPKLETTTDNDQTPKTETNQPIPPAEFPKQYRAIGLLWGKYVPGEEITQGTLITSDGTKIEAVVLGRLLGLLKSRIDLEKEHLWVVYPRTRDKGEKIPDESGDPLSTTEETEESTSITESIEELQELSSEPSGDDEPSPEEKEELQELSSEPKADSETSLEQPKQPSQKSKSLKADSETSPESPKELQELSKEPKGDDQPSLHVQMAGIWEPETLHPGEPAPVIEHKPDYFSIRGEVVYQNKEEGWVMVKIIQFSRKKTDEKPPYFNLKLLGFLPERPVKNFWNLDVEREGSDLVIQDGSRIAYLGKKKPKKKPSKKGKSQKKAQRGDAGQQQPLAAVTPKEPPKLKKK